METTTLFLKLQSISDDPLDYDDQLFRSGDWTLSLTLTALAFTKRPGDTSNIVATGIGRSLTRRAAIGRPPGRRAAEELVSVQVFMNETSNTLAEIALTDYKNSDPKAKPRIIDAEARRISQEEHRALSLKFHTSYNLFSHDSEEIFRTIMDTYAAYQLSGTELGVIHVESGFHKEGTRQGALELRGNDTTFRIGPVAQGIAPGEGVVLLTRFSYDEYWEDIRSGLQDWLGQRVPYATRLSFRPYG